MRSRTDDPALELADLAGLAPAARHALKSAQAALRQGDLGRAERELTIALVHAPLHAEPHRLLGLTLARRGRPQHAAECFRAALAARPRDAAILRALVDAETAAGDLPAAIAAAQTLAETAADAAGFAVLSDLQERHGEMAQALAACERALALDANDTASASRRGRCLFQLGRSQDAERQFRAVLAAGGDASQAWHGLAELRRAPFDAADRAALERLLAQPLRPMQRVMLEHVLGRACEDLGDYAAAFEMFCAAARRQRELEPWDAVAFERYAAGVRDAFPAPLAAGDEEFGNEVIFVVGMPRSGSTLVEQVLAAHPAVEGASELPDLQVVIRQESERRQAPLTQWAGRASAADWRRLGRTYLARTARWRTAKARFTDKMPGNWLYAEAALAMLPGARVLDCRRDPLETCWSCFKQFFAPGAVPWSRTFDDLARYWRLCRDHGDRLAARYPARVRIQSYEALLAAPQREIAALLDFCALPFDAACLAPHAVQRTVRTASASQVREPIAPRASNAALYGARLAALRAALR